MPSSLGLSARGMRLVALLLSSFGLGLYACPPNVGDDDDLVLPANDDDDDDDDDTAPSGDDDDDFTIPEGLPVGGNLLWQASDGVVPTERIRVGLFELSSLDGQYVEPYGALVSAEGLTSGNSIYTVYIEDEPASSAMTPLSGFDVDAVLYVAFAYVDSSENDAYDSGELLLGASDSLVVFVEDIVPFPSQLSALGAGPGWNLLDSSFLDAAPMDFTHVPEGTNSSNGPSIRTELLPDEGGSIQVRAEFSVPHGSVVSAWHHNVSTGDLDSNVELFVTPASNDASQGAQLLSWSVEGAPPSTHIAVLPSPVGDQVGVPGGGASLELQGALYRSVVYFDDGDQVFGAGGCDTLLAVGEGRPLVWLDPAALTLDVAYLLQRHGQTIGWSLFDESLGAWRPFAVGVDLTQVTAGDDDDSAGDDDDSAGDDDDSADSSNPIPDDCLGDDDDSAADDSFSNGT